MSLLDDTVQTRLRDEQRSLRPRRGAIGLFATALERS